MRKVILSQNHIFIVIEASRSYFLKFDKLLIPMAKGDRSCRVMDLAFDLSRYHSSEITALTVKDETRDHTWSDKVSMVSRAYQKGKERGIKVVPKVKTSDSVRESLVEEANTHGYDMVMIAASRRSPLSASIFGGIGDYVVKNTRVPTVATSVKTGHYPYRSILFPVSEGLNTRTAAAFALYLKQATGAKLHLADFRRYDQRRTHGFNLLFDSLDKIMARFGPEIGIIRGGYYNSMAEDLNFIINQVSADAVIIGVRSDQSGRIRLNSNLKSIIKESPADAILVKK